MVDSSPAAFRSDATPPTRRVDANAAGERFHGACSMTEAKCPPDDLLSTLTPDERERWQELLRFAKEHPLAPPIPPRPQVLPDDLPEPVAAMVDQVIARGTLWKVLDAPTLGCPSPAIVYHPMLVLYSPPADLCSALLSALAAFPDCRVCFVPPNDWTVPPELRAPCEPGLQLSRDDIVELRMTLARNPLLADSLREIADRMEDKGADEYSECQDGQEALREIARWFAGENCSANDLQDRIVQINTHRRAKLIEERAAYKAKAEQRQREAAKR